MSHYKLYLYCFSGTYCIYIYPSLIYTVLVGPTVYIYPSLIYTVLVGPTVYIYPSLIYTVLVGHYCNMIFTMHNTQHHSPLDKLPQEAINS